MGRSLLIALALCVSIESTALNRGVSNIFACQNNTQSLGLAVVDSNAGANGDFLQCKLCDTLMQFMVADIANGQGPTSKTMLLGLGEAAAFVCKASGLQKKIPNLDCSEMPAVIDFVFTYFVAPRMNHAACVKYVAACQRCGDQCNQ